MSSLLHSSKVDRVRQLAGRCGEVYAALAGLIRLLYVDRRLRGVGYEITGLLLPRPVGLDVGRGREGEGATANLAFKACVSEQVYT